MNAYNPHVSMVHAVIWLGLSNVVVNPVGLEHYVKLVGFIQYLDTSVSIRIVNYMYISRGSAFLCL